MLAPGEWWHGITAVRDNGSAKKKAAPGCGSGVRHGSAVGGVVWGHDGLGGHDLEGEFGLVPARQRLWTFARAESADKRTDPESDGRDGQGANLKKKPNISCDRYFMSHIRRLASLDPNPGKINFLRSKFAILISRA